MGNGDLGAVHTELHRRLVAAIAMPRIPRDELPTECLERSVFSGLLATNRHLQPEMLGALGLIELQAGPRCRKVVAALRRLDAPTDAFPFYEEHAVADPRHGKRWLDEVVAPLADEWGDRMVRGARWRQLVNERFFEAMRRRFESEDAA
jgi:pyrroloquinoline quinone (PQQ) biosynthesis protein C